MGAILLILGILTVLALIWSAIESRKPRVVLGGGMPSTGVQGPHSPEDSMRDALIAGRGFKPKEWEAMRGAVFFVHDDLSEGEFQQILESFGESSDRIPHSPASLESAETALDEEPAPAARERFRTELQLRGLSSRVEPLGTFYAPGPFDAYQVRERR